MQRIAILDDWQGVARRSADWSPLGGRAELVFFADAFGAEDEAARDAHVLDRDRLERRHATRADPAADRSQHL